VYGDGKMLPPSDFQVARCRSMSVIACYRQLSYLALIEKRVHTLSAVYINYLG